MKTDYNVEYRKNDSKNVFFLLQRKTGFNVEEDEKHSVLCNNCE